MSPFVLILGLRIPAERLHNQSACAAFHCLLGTQSLDSGGIEKISVEAKSKTFEAGLH